MRILYLDINPQAGAGVDRDGGRGAASHAGRFPAI